MLSLLVTLWLSVSSHGLLADQTKQLDAASLEAVQKTQQLMTNPEERKKATQENAETSYAAQQISSLAGSAENEQDIYELASEIFGDLAKEANGDPLKIMEMLEQAKKDPNAFGKKLTPAQREKLKALSTKALNPAGGKKP
jgi:hypothetical protein